MPRTQHAAKQPQKPAKPAPKNAHDKRKHVPPVVIRKELEAGPHAQSAGMREVVLDGKGDPVIKVTDPTVEAVASVSTEKLDELAFMREKVTIQILDSSEPQADPSFMVGVNGRQQIFVRGREYTVPRFVVEGLARAKPVGFRNEEYFKPDGERAVRNPTTRGLRYPFSVMADPSGAKGSAWLKKVLAQP